MMGAGMIEMDVALFMAIVFAAGVNIFYIPKCWRQSRGIAVMRLLRLAGWVVLGSRFGNVLFTTGDIMISVPGAIGLFFLASGEIAALFNRGKNVPL